MSENDHFVTCRHCGVGINYHCDELEERNEATRLLRSCCEKLCGTPVDEQSSSLAVVALAIESRVERANNERDAEKDHDDARCEARWLAETFLATGLPDIVGWLAKAKEARQSLGEMLHAAESERDELARLFIASHGPDWHYQYCASRRMSNPVYPACNCGTSLAARVLERAGRKG